MAASDNGLALASLLDLRDELAVATRLVAALTLATQAPHLPQAERRALCELATLCRERLEDCIEAADALLARQRDGSQAGHAM